MFKIARFLFAMNKMAEVIFVMISGHTDITREQFDATYVPRLKELADQGAAFILGGAPGTDRMAQQWLISNGHGLRMTVYDRKGRDGRLSPSGNHVALDKNDQLRDERLTRDSVVDVAFIKSSSSAVGSGTFANMLRRHVGAADAKQFQRWARSHVNGVKINDVPNAIMRYEKLRVAQRALDVWNTCQIT